MLQRFVRLEASRTTPGHGLGMSMVAAIAAAHFAEVALTDETPGLGVRIVFPRRPSAAADRRVDAARN